ncbi:phosphate ABC transporter permease PstA [Sporolactobacillus terrae]|uniref:Phosphate transport system permease protein PstA n=1 Tax=Sporolactobacillus terrae TaxID=269673 RepID=A0A410DA55_9BACL|nr:phosphate ABC transporter permease PstA [Sporolactobacillus terrae]QAA23004.1 phosphate ABC transporter, permease protein PstA [Sporolactobacillus terrae]QAA25977.1 phosphate ABC transporter, permease protein PstA [Sporolactobacillus terrae]UAK15074.1 phosphate ABC transporter permease PstA [Sporolactobacillus terrae]BBN99415.1 putative ABC transporter permease protein YqgI [Sporolactobacillus terrae]
MNSKVTNRIALSVIVLCAAAMAAVLISMLGYILVKGLSSISWHFLTTSASPFMPGGGIKDQLWNSFYVLFITMLLTVPIGVCGGIYLAEYAKPGKITSFIRTCVEVLASLPSIVVGMFGMLLFVNYFGFKYSVLSGALALTVFNLPVIVRVTEDGFRALPRHQKEGGLALGMTHWHTIKTILLPAAFPSILTGIILSAGRVFGESAALLFTAGLSTPDLNFENWNPLAPDSPLNLFRSAETLSVHIWSVNTGGIMPDVDTIANGSAAVLVICVLIFNLFARMLGKIINQKFSGK